MDRLTLQERWDEYFQGNNFNDRKERRCINCGKMFMSPRSGIRRCNYCKGHRNKNLSRMDEIILASRRE